MPVVRGSAILSAPDTCERRRTLARVPVGGRAGASEDTAGKWTSAPEPGAQSRSELIPHRLSSSIQFYRSLMGITSVSASVAPGGKQHLLHVRYDVPDGSASTASSPLPRDGKSGKAQAELVLAFDATTRLLQGAEIRGAEVDIEEATAIAVATQDVQGLVADVLNRLRPVSASP